MLGKEIIKAILDKGLVDSEISVSADTEFASDVDHVIIDIETSEEETGVIRAELAE